MDKIEQAGKEPVEAAARAICEPRHRDPDGWPLVGVEGYCGRCLDQSESALAAALPFLGAAPSATHEDVETITIPRPHVPHGPATVARDIADADYLRRAARDLEEFYKPFGSNLRATIVALIRDAADAITPKEKP